MNFDICIKENLIIDYNNYNPPKPLIYQIFIEGKALHIYMPFDCFRKKRIKTASPTGNLRLFLF